MSSFEQQLDDLIKAAWIVIDSDFDSIALHHWRLTAFECLTDMVGPDHVYTRHFEKFARQGGRTDLLAAGGILSAAKEQASCNLQQSGAPQSQRQHRRIGREVI